MKYSLLSFLVLFAINNLLHYISEKVIIVIFILFLFFLMSFLSNIINNEFKSKIDYILNDINAYVNVIFNFLFINKLFYLNLKSLKNSFLSLNSILNRRIKTWKFYAVLTNKLNSLSNNAVFLIK